MRGFGAMANGQRKTHDRSGISKAARWMKSHTAWLLSGALIGLVAASSPSAAQDTGNPFSGYYLGFHVGHVGTEATMFTGVPYIANLPTEDVSVPGRNDKLDFESGLLGFHTGYNFTNQSNFLFGVEADWTRLNAINIIHGGGTELVNNEAFVFSHRSQAELDWQASLRARLGYVAGKTLFFGTIGAALLKVQWEERASVFDDDANRTFVQNHSASDTIAGLAVGGGIEYAVTPDLIIGADYLYENFGGVGSLPFGHSTPPQQGNIGDLDLHKIRARISIMFGND